jgi:hypothetical protein
MEKISKEKADSIIYYQEQNSSSNVTHRQEEQPV